ncbi:aminoglycoside phosphotransferase family protein [Streptomyces sp. 8K308]|uniref:phosphotransferase n=1 Tax=Streptomyces sp. 8K308 TaxID=2530388 RepID=UPI0010510A0A|nr:phosphotransferase [Streptomyces sp. 8K308]TDC25487.1 aminoglycoside phosphotransferase family protein [Streptomyces sp. 8K308]
MSAERKALVQEVPLTGGKFTAEVVRVGDTVRRTRGERAAFAAAVLRHLEAVGYPYAPRHLGVDDRGRDILTFVDGRTTDHPSQRAAGAYARGGAALRALHEATAGHPLAGDQECVIHGDPGVYNTVFRDGLPVAFVDWDACRPGRRVDDLAYAAWGWCVLERMQVPIEQQAAHLRDFRDGYDPAFDAGTLLDAIVEQQTRIVELESAMLGDPAQPPARREHAEGAVGWADGGRDLVLRHRDLFLAVLTSGERPRW